MTHARLALASLVAACGLAAPAQAQLRVAMWNMSNYDSGGGSRDAAFKTAIYGVFQGRSMAPDIFIGQEILSLTSANAVLSILNTAPGSPGGWSMATFVNGPDTDMVFCYRTSKVQFLGQTLVLAGGNTAGAPRDIRRYDVRLVGYTSAGATLALYSDHMKAGSTATDKDRRLIEATAIRENANGLPAGWQFAVAGDFNIQSSTETSYQMLIGSQANNRGRAFDPINRPGTWNNASSFRFIHTQAPAGTSGSDDRFDFILLGGELLDGVGFDYIGNPAAPYSSTTWNDPNHSYRCWGQDGSYFNNTIISTTNAMVGATIAQALYDSANIDTSGGHLPVFLDLRVPAVLDSTSTIDFGSVPQNSLAQQTLTVSNAGNTALWTAAGIANLRYTIAPSAGLTAPGGTFIAAPGAAGNLHTITLNTATVGPFAGTVIINSDAPDQPAQVVNVTGTVVAAGCYANCDGSTTAPILNVQDFACFLNAFAAGESYANCDGSTTSPVLNVQDFACFLNAFAAGCP
jgi:hypothetical protein